MFLRFEEVTLFTQSDSFVGGNTVTTEERLGIELESVAPTCLLAAIQEVAVCELHESKRKDTCTTIKNCDV